MVGVTEPVSPECWWPSVWDHCPGMQSSELTALLEGPVDPPRQVSVTAPPAQCSPDPRTCAFRGHPCDFKDASPAQGHLAAHLNVIFLGLGAWVLLTCQSHVPTGRWGRQESSSHRTSSGHSRSGQGQHWRDQGPGKRSGVCLTPALDIGCVFT